MQIVLEGSLYQEEIKCYSAPFSILLKSSCMAVLKLLSQDFTEEGWLKKSMSRCSISPTKALFVAHMYADEGKKRLSPFYKVIVCVQIFPMAFCPSWDIVVTPLGGRGVWQLTVSVFLSIKNQNEKFHQEIH